MTTNFRLIPTPVVPAAMGRNTTTILETEIQEWREGGSESEETKGWTRGGKVDIV
jgi:hypothetical protein